MMSENRYAVAIIIAFMLTACSGAESNTEVPDRVLEMENVAVFTSESEPKYSIQLIKEHLFTETDEVYFSHIGEVAVDNLGRVLISEMSMGNRAIHMFNPDGTYEGQLGSEGRGPGEYQTPVHLQIVGATAYIYDNLLNRITAYSLTDLEDIRSISVSAGDYIDRREIGGLSPQSLFVLDNKEIVIGFGAFSSRIEDNYTRYFGADEQGKFMPDKLFKLRAKNVFSFNDGIHSSESLLPFDRDSFIQYSSDRFYTVWSDQFLIKIYDENGDMVKGIYHPVNKVPFNQDDYVENFMPSRLERAVQHMDFPEYWPVVEDLLVDDQERLWVAVNTDDFEMYEWWVLDNNGELKARFKWSRNKRIKDIKNGFLYTLERESVDGVQNVAKYQIELDEI
jgi:hypothetical protein